jgi:hypothetical protein
MPLGEIKKPREKSQKRRGALEVYLQGGSKNHNKFDKRIRGRGYI